jgi:lipid-binding SYLF domain-containing protein
MRYSLIITMLIAVGTLVSGCAAPRGTTITDKQQFVRSMRDRTLAELYASRPDLRRRVEDAAGYAVFSNVNIHVLLLSTGHGYGMAVDNRTGEETFMRMAALGAGFGAGLKDLRAVFVFPSDYTFRRFVNEGWEFAGGAEAAATSDDVGGAVGAGAQAGAGGAKAGVSGKHRSTGYAAVNEGMEIYRITRAGVALHATLAGTKYWSDRNLN